MISCIAAVDRGYGIGFQGSMPWPRLKDDLKWFKNLTVDNIVIMGSTTWYSLGRPLSDRINIVLSRFSKVGANFTCAGIDSALEICSSQFPEKEIFIIGGQALYDSTMHIVDKFYITEIDASYTCDKHFNLNFVKENFPVVINHGNFMDPISYVIKEYNK